MATAALTDDLPRIRAELNHLVDARVTNGLSPHEHRRYEALLLRESELLSCRRAAE